MPEIGFLIIGAPKAGTTSLFEYMRGHPEIHMPGEKELYFFNMDRNYKRGWDWYEAAVTRNAPPHAVCGEATTEYISGAPYGDPTEPDIDAAPESADGGTLEEAIPRRIRAALPEVKLICVLRDPVKRAYSHYRMLALGRAESRPFEQVVAELTEPATLEHSKRVRSRTNGYIVNGEYARLLGGFLRVFPREQLKILFSDDLSARPKETIAEVFDFVGVAEDFVPDSLGKRFREAAVKERVPGLNLIAWQSSFARSRFARAMWHALPDRPRSSIDHAYNVANYRVEMWNGWRGVADDDLSPAMYERLAAHYLADSELLAQMLDREVPWVSNWARAS
jgi:hypothetical protein